MKILSPNHLPLILSSFIVQYCTVTFIFSVQCGSALSLPTNETVPAVLVFGDSIVDPGNNNYIPTLIKCNFPPYGRDFSGGTPTGRFSNGLVPSDIFAQKFGIKKLLPAYLDPNLQIQDFLTGVSFASGGCGYDPMTAKIVSVLSLKDQLDMFKEYIQKIKEAVGETSTATLLSKSIYMVCSGSDDIANTYIQTLARRFRYDMQAYTDLMAEAATSFLEELHELGARRIGVFGISPIGCVPSQRTLTGNIQRGCSDYVNQAALLFNAKLSSLMDSLGKKYPDARFVYLDSYNAMLGMIQNHTQYGFEVADRGCCGTGNVEVSILCNALSITTCSNASQYIFWDSYHPSQKAYQILGSLVLDEKIEDFF